MRTSVVFLMGLLLGSAISTSLAQGNRLAGTSGVNHVAMSVDNFDAALDFYTQKMGFREVLNMRDNQGQPTLAFVQAGRDTFLELAPARSVGNQWMVANVTAPGGIRIELTPLGPESVPMKATTSWGQ